MSEGITRAEWMKALEDAGEAHVDDRESMTAKEFAEMFDPPLDRTTATRKLLRLVEAGVAVKTKKTATSGDGRRQNVTSYKLLKQGAQSGGNRPRRTARRTKIGR